MSNAQRTIVGRPRALGVSRRGRLLGRLRRFRRGGATPGRTLAANGANGARVARRWALIALRALRRRPCRAFGLSSGLSRPVSDDERVA